MIPKGIQRILDRWDDNKDFTPSFEFEILHEDELVGKVKYDSDKDLLHAESFTDSIYKMPWNKNINSEIDLDYILNFIRGRCFLEGRADQNQLLESLKLTIYDPLKIVKVNRAVSMDDRLWFRFPDDKELKYEDVKFI